MSYFKLPKKARQNNERVTVCGISFDSKWEADRYLQLLYLQQQGVIRDLQLQKKFELIPAVREPDTVGKRGGVKQGKVIERAVYYVADFVYVKGGETVVEDAKGYDDTSSAMYKVFIIKRKLMLWRFGLRVKEVRRDKGH